jgi:plastocyanin
MRLSLVAQGISPAIAIAALKGCATSCVVCALLFVAGCSKPADAPPATAAAPATPPAASDAPGRVEGRAPAPTGGATVVVVLEPRTAREFAPQTDKPVMDQVGQTFGPEVLLVRTGQPVEFRNSDDTLHNVHVDFDERREPAFNVAIPTGGSYTYSFKHDGFYRVGCDIHPAMAAMIYATTTPFAMLAEPDGRFAFDGVPPGTWTITVFAAGKRLQRDVEVGGGVTSVTVE